MRLIMDLGMQFSTDKSKKKVRFGLYECPICLSYFSASTQNVKSGRSTKCRSCQVSIKNTTHGQSGSRIHYVWLQMKDRCLNAKNKSYKNYGERGVSVCKSWVDSFEAFRDWAINNGYKEGLSIDRIDNDGNYEPDNCRWTTRIIQGRNTRRIRSNNTSGFRGVSLSGYGKKWTAHIRCKSRLIHLGTFDYPWTAGMAYDSYVIRNNLENTMNFTKRKAV